MLAHVEVAVISAVPYLCCSIFVVQELFSELLRLAAGIETSWPAARIETSFGGVLGLGLTGANASRCGWGAA